MSQPLEIGEHERAEIVATVVAAEALGPLEPGGQPPLLDARRVEPRGVQDGSAGAIDGVRALAGEHAGVLLVAVDLAAVGKAHPAAADADHLEPHLGAAVDDRLDHRVEARHVAAAGEDPDASIHGRRC